MKTYRCLVCGRETIGSVPTSGNNAGELVIIDWHIFYDDPTRTDHGPDGHEWQEVEVQSAGVRDA